MTEPDLTAVEAYRKAQEAEYGQYVAAEDISINGVRAFNRFDPVPAGHIEREVVARESVMTRAEFDQLRDAAAASVESSDAPATTAPAVTPPPSPPLSSPKTTAATTAPDAKDA